MTDAHSAQLGRLFLYVLVLVGAYLSYLILSPFLAAITWAVLFAVLFHGMHARLSARIGPGRAALVTTLVVGIVIVAPAVVLISALVGEVPQVTDSVARMSQSAPRQIQQIWAEPGFPSRCPRIRPNSWPRAHAACSPSSPRVPARSSPTS
jgi:predicted PurR-regulated permease PerM